MLLDQFISVPTAQIFPASCIVCREQHGPFADTKCEHVMAGRLYVCADCVGNAARAIGLVEGDKHSELLDTAKRLGRAELDIAKRDEKLTAWRRKANEFEAKWEEAAAKAAVAEQRVAQLEETLAAAARASLELVSGGAA